MSGKKCDFDRSANRNLIIVTCFQIHLAENHRDYQCPECSQNFSTVNQLESHRAETCVRATVICPLPGCRERFRADQLEKHYFSEDHQHQLTLLTQQCFIRHDETRLSDVIKGLLTCNEQLDEIKELLDHLSVAHDELKKDGQQIHTYLSDLETHQNSMMQTYATLDAPIAELSRNKEQSELMFNEIKQLGHIKEPLMLDENSSAIFIFDLVENDGQFSITPAYANKLKTSMFGYEFMINVGTSSISRQVYLSVFLTLESSQFDSLLIYPFPCDIYCILCDQSRKTPGRIHRIEHRTDNSNLNQREEYPILNFVPIETLTNKQESYCINGRFFLRFFFDFLHEGYHVPSKPIESIKKT